MKQTKVCIHCKIEKPISEFYEQPGGAYGVQAYCKACSIKNMHKNRTAEKLQRKHAGRYGEALLVEKLRSVGVYAAPGKSSEYVWVDVVAWGCVRIEVKHSSTRQPDGHFVFSFPSSRRHKDVEIVVLVCDIEGEIEYYVLPASHRIFKSNNSKNHRITYHPGLRWGYLATIEEMNEYRNAWHLIEEYRLRFYERLASPISNSSTPADIIAA